MMMMLRSLISIWYWSQRFVTDRYTHTPVTAK